MRKRSNNFAFIDAQNVYMGTKKRLLTGEEREENRFIASVRVVAEHALSGLKRFKVMLHTLRNRIDWFDERVARICAGLWNRHLRYAR